MRKISYILFIAAALTLVALPSCKQQPIMDYQQEAGVYFANFSSKFTFVEHLDKLEEGHAVLNIPVRITGLASDQRRTFKAIVYEDKELFEDNELIPADADMYTIGEGYVEAGMYDGTLPLTINYRPKMDEKEYTVFLTIIPTDDFPVVDLFGQPVGITFGNVITKPENWNSKLQRYFGNYSNSWYKQILEWTGLSSLPYWYVMGADQPNITPEEAERWPMSLNEVKVYAYLVRELLTEWKNDNPGKTMVHLDGEFEGQEVKMGNF